eukprot:2041451-Alexandrium_andersonii.AAC.1
MRGASLFTEPALQGELGRKVPTLAASRGRSPLGACVTWGPFGLAPHKTAFVGRKLPTCSVRHGLAKRG